MTWNEGCSYNERQLENYAHQLTDRVSALFCNQQMVAESVDIREGERPLNAVTGFIPSPSIYTCQPLHKCFP